MPTLTNETSLLRSLLTTLTKYNLTVSEPLTYMANPSNPCRRRLRRACSLRMCRIRGWWPENTPRKSMCKPLELMTLATVCKIIIGSELTLSSVSNINIGAEDMMKCLRHNRWSWKLLAGVCDIIIGAESIANCSDISQC